MARRKKQEVITEFKDINPNYMEELNGLHKVKISDVLNKKVVIYKYVVRTSSYPNVGKFISVVFSYNDNQDKKLYFNTTSKVVTDILNKISDYLPVRATIVRVKNYFTLQ